LQWISDSFLNHPVCAEMNQPVYRPTRLIGLGIDAKIHRASLIESSPTDAPVKYLVLSYCCGNTMPHEAKAYMSTLEAHKRVSI
jgi:hypothetical protein